MGPTPSLGMWLWGTWVGSSPWNSALLEDRELSGTEVCACGLCLQVSTSGHVSGSHAGPEGQGEFGLQSGGWKVVGKDLGRGDALALTSVALQGGGLGAQLSQHSLHTPLEIKLSVWAAVGEGG